MTQARRPAVRKDGSAALTVHVCAGCAPDALAEVRSALSATEWGDDVRVADADCLGACDAPLVLSLQAPGRAVYLFAGIDVAELDDLGATCRSYLAQPGGWIEDARPCGRLRFRLRARVPPAKRR